MAGDGWAAVVAPGEREVFVWGLTLRPDQLPEVWAAVHAIAPGAPVIWSVGPSATPANLADRLRALGARDEVTLTALATEREPPPSPLELDVRRIRTFDEFLLALDVQQDAADAHGELVARDRAHARETFERRQARPGGEWLAYLDGEPVAYAGAIAADAGLFLVGGATRRSARGRGCYRALVRARWDYAVQLGTPAMAVHALETSRPILERLGFEPIATLEWLASGG